MKHHTNMLNKVKTSELTGVALDWAVGTALGRVPKYNMESHGRTWYGWWLAGKGYEYERLPSYSSDWAQGGPIIEREGFHRIFINVSHGYTVSKKIVTITDEDEDIRWVHEAGPTLLIAAMRCYVASKLGDTVDIPKELM